MVKNDASLKRYGLHRSLSSRLFDDVTKEPAKVENTII